MDFDWDDLRYVLAVARGASLSAAARRLGVNHSTVFRRLGGLETRLGVRLFERLPGGFAPTPAGEDLARVAEGMEAEILDLGRRLAGQDLRLSGRLRLTAPDDVVEHLLMTPLARFREAYPDIALEMVIDNRMLSLTKREADVAVRPTRRPPETLVGRRIGRLASALYQSAQDTDTQPGAQERRWIAWEEGGGPPSVSRWLAARAPAAKIVYRSDSLLNQLVACRKGLGTAVLPCFLGDPLADLRRLEPPLPELETELWLLTHPDLRHTARVRALMDLLYEALRALRPQLAGTEPGPANLH